MKAGRVDAATQLQTKNETGLDRIQIGDLWLSQSGNAMPAGYGTGDQKQLVPRGMEDFFERVEIVGLSPSGTRFTNSFDLDAKGHLVPNTRSRPLGHVPYEVALIGKDGSRWSATVDISPSKTGTSHQGYDTVSKLELVRQAPPPPEEVKLGDFWLSQSGSVLPSRYGEIGSPPVVANNDGFFTEMIVTSLSPSNTRFSNKFEIDADGHLKPRGSTRPLGDVPYQITLVGKDGSQYVANVDISSAKTGTRHQGYETISSLVVRRADERAEAASDAPLNGADASFVQTGGATSAKPQLGTSPLGVFWKR